MRERSVEAYLAKRVKALGGVAWKWVSPGTNGVPDRLVFLPGGRAMAVEVKAPGESLAPLQVARAETLRALGFRVLMIDSHAGVEDALR